MSFLDLIWTHTGKSLSEALLFAEHGENMLCTKIVLNVRNNFCTQHVLPRFELGIFMYWTCSSMNNLSSYYWLVDAKIRTSDKDLPVRLIISKACKNHWIVHTVSFVQIKLTKIIFEWGLYWLWGRDIKNWKKKYNSNKEQNHSLGAY